MAEERNGYFKNSTAIIALQKCQNLTLLLSLLSLFGNLCLVRSHISKAQKI